MGQLRTRGAVAAAGMVVVAAAVLVPGTARADESPTIDDRATLGRAKLVSPDAVRVTFRLTCPRGDTFQAFMVTLQTVPTDWPVPTTSDVTASGGTSGTCRGRSQRVTVDLVNRGSDYVGEPVAVPLRKGCGLEYGVTSSGTGWDVAFDRGGADGGPDGPGPALCFR